MFSFGYVYPSQHITYLPICLVSHSNYNLFRFKTVWHDPHPRKRSLGLDNEGDLAFSSLSIYKNLYHHYRDCHRISYTP